MEWKLSRRTQQRFRHFRVWKEFDCYDREEESCYSYKLKKAAHAVEFWRPAFSIY